MNANLDDMELSMLKIGLNSEKRQGLIPVKLYPDVCILFVRDKKRATTPL